MRPARLAQAAALAALLLLAGCQSPDVGQPCKLPSKPGAPSPGPTPDTAAGDYLEFGNTFCDNLVCIVSPAVPGGRYNGCSGDQCGYCSKPCVSDQDCSRSETGLACRQMVLDPAFIASLDEATRLKYLADIQFSSYCAVPR
ncbi:MAG: adventurous gliding motility lipoprotein CglC [Anaeromyxobacter sp.]|nr:adventurous gliding motility lipoprotein CglC [Anaeromyxobacter sp.]MBL0276272.1 adventurous gliding motility lipoprotein CglC [Anaeromyxobacter sp.]